MRTTKSLVLSLVASSLLIVACSSGDGNESNENPAAGGSSAAGKGGTSAGGTSTGGTSSGGKGGAAGGTSTGGKGGSGGSNTGGTDAGGTSSGGTDAGGTDAGGTDAGGTDAGGTDAGGTDAGGTDAGGTDAGGTDAGGTDAGGSDACGTDAGGTDAGGSDAGGTDAGGTDAGGSDAGGSDAGGSDAGGSDAGGSGGSGNSISATCQNCIATNCDAEFNACAADPACLACATGDPTTPECLGNPNLLAAVACACQPTACGATDCAAECTLFGGGQGGSGAGGDAGAGGSDAGGSDAGGTDAGGTDAGGTDAGGSDAGGSDAGGTDAGGTDAGGSGGSDAGGSDAGGTDAGGTSSGGTDAGGAGGSGQAGDTGSGGSAGACVTQSAEATLVKKPVDVIFVIDNSGSMSNEIKGVQDNINQNFAQIIEASGLDYRVIMVARHGNYSTAQSVCIAAPLSGTTCSPIPAQPANTSKFFHYSTEIASTDSLRKIIETFPVKDEFNLAPNGWRQWLRADAYKIFVEITDDNQNPNSPQSGAYTAAAFETKLFALPGGQFGTLQKRNYTFHSIIGMPTKGGDPASAYLPTDPKVTGTSKPSQVCSTAVNNGATYQDLSILTGGLRFPVCNTGSYNAVFQKIAEGVIEGSKVACDFAIPDPSIIDPATVKIEYTPGDGAPVKTYLQVPDANACAPGKIYISNDIVHMCPDTCTEVQADSKAKLSVLYGCKIFL